MDKTKADKKPMQVNNATNIGKKFKCKVCGYKGTRFVNIDFKKDKIKKKCCPSCYDKSVDNLVELEEDKD